MENIKDMFGGSNYKIIGLKGRDHCTCFDEHCWGILKNGLAVKNKDVKGYHYSLNTVRKCERYLITFFNKKFGAGDWDRKHHPEYLYFLNKTKK